MERADIMTSPGHLGTIGVVEAHQIVTSKKNGTSRDISRQRY